MSILFFLCSSDSQFTDDLTPTTFKSITQACKTVTQRVGIAIEGKLLQTQKSEDESKGEETKIENMETEISTQTERNLLRK